MEGPLPKSARLRTYIDALRNLARSDLPDRVKLIKKNIDLYLEEGARGRALEDLRSAIVSRVTPRLRSALYVSVGQRLSLTRRADAQRASASQIRLSRPASSMRQRSAMTNSSKSPRDTLAIGRKHNLDQRLRIAPFRAVLRFFGRPGNVSALLPACMRSTLMPSFVHFSTL